MVKNLNVFIFGGTGSLGRALAKRLLPLNNNLFIFSRDEAKQHYMRVDFPSEKCLNFILGDVRDKDKVKKALKDSNPNIIINAAAMKQVPACEFFPEEALLTNTIGTKNIVEAVEELYWGRKVLSVSTDKSCKPVNSYGMTKALQERIHLNGKRNVFNCVRYGNVLESTGSVIPFFKHKIENKENLPITHIEMTRFLMSLDESVSLIFKALKDNNGGKIFIPKIKSARIVDLAEVMLEGTGLDWYETKIRPGEKIHEILISEEEVFRTSDENNEYVIHDIKGCENVKSGLIEEYSSKDFLMEKDELKYFLVERGVI